MVLVGIHNTCQSTSSQSSQKMTDNIACMFYIKRQGGAKSPSLRAKAVTLWNWCICHQISISAIYLSGIQNMTADMHSRKFSQNHKWEIDTMILHSIFTRLETPKIDLFTTVKKKKCPQFCSRAGWGHRSLEDAFLLKWNRPLLYAYPPVLLISKAIYKIKKEKVRVILIAPTWPRQTWFPYLLQLVVWPPVILHHVPHLLSQYVGQIHHPDLKVLHLKVWLLDGSRM